MIQAPYPAFADPLQPLPGALPAIPQAPPPPVPRSSQPFEPRQLPARSGLEGAGPIGKPMDEFKNETSSGEYFYPPKPNRRNAKPWVRILVPSVLCIAIGVLVYGLVQFLSPQEKSGKVPEEDRVRRILPPEEGTGGYVAGIHDTDGSELFRRPVAEESPASVEGTAERLLSGQESVGIRAGRLLEQFLQASTLEERWPMMETPSSAEDLSLTILAKPLPECVSWVMNMQETNDIENLTDIYFDVVFDLGAGRKSAQTLLVRVRAQTEPKVIVEPFLDLFGGRLAAYAAGPQEKPGYFHAIVFPGAFCNDESVPNPEKKRTLKLLSQENGKPITNAYFGRHSSIANMLEDLSSGLRYGQTKPCTLVLSWNTTENPQKPYLEANEIKALNWNP